MKKFSLVIGLALILFCNLSYAAQTAIVQTDTRQEAWAKETLNNTDLQNNIDGKADVLGADDNYVTDAEKGNIVNLSGTNTGDMSDAAVKTAYENNANTNAVTDAEKTVLGNTSGTNTGDQAITPEGTAVKSTGETGGTKFLREDGDDTSSWQTISGGGDLLADGTIPLTADWDAGAYEIRALTFESDVVTGTAPFTIESTTVVPNLNVDLLDGESASAFEDADAAIVKSDENEIITGNWTFESGIGTGSTSVGGGYYFSLEDTDLGTNYAGFGVFGDLTISTIYLFPLAVNTAGQSMRFAVPGNQDFSDGTTKSAAVGTFFTALEDANDTIGDDNIDWGSGAGQVDLADIPGGTAGAHVWDFGGATSFELPNSAAPTVDADGEIALDTTITSHDGLLVYYQGAEAMVIPAIPLADLTTTDGHVIDYNSAGTKFTMDAPAAGGETNSLETVTTGIATTEIPIGTAADTVVYAPITGQSSMTNDGVMTNNAVTLDDETSVEIMADHDGMDDDEYNGITVTGLNAGEGLTQWNLVRLHNDADPWHLAEADVASEFPAQGIVIATVTDTNEAKVLVQGVVRNEGWTGLTIGGAVYLGEASAGSLTQTAPSTAGDCVQIVGFAISDSEILFDFSRPYQEVE